MILMTESTRRLTYKMKPTPRQEMALAGKEAFLRQLWNGALEERVGAYRLAGKSVGFAEQCRAIKQFAPDVPGWRGLVHTHEAQTVLKRLDRAFAAFFRRVRAGETPGFPRFRGKGRGLGWGYKEHRNGFRIFQDETMRHGRVRLFGVPGTVRLRGATRTPGRVLCADVFRTVNGWFLSVVVSTRCAEREPAPEGTARSFDLGLENAATVAREDETFYEIPNMRHLAAEADAIREEQRALSALARQRKVSGRAHAAAKRRLARRHAKVAARRKDAHHKVSAQLVREARLLITEKLAVSNMMRSARGHKANPGTGVAQKAGLNRSLSDAGMASLLNMIRYKAEEAGSDLLIADTRRLKPSQRCPDCDRVRKKPLSVRVHECECGCRLSRDQASALVLLRWGLGRGAPPHPAGTVGPNAAGAA